MKFTTEMKTNWHDTDASRCVRPSKILEYMQETADIQCAASGMPLDGLRDEKGLAFIVGSIAMTLHAPLHSNEKITVKTWSKLAKSFIFTRYFEIFRGEQLIAEAATNWVLIDLNTKAMVRGSEHPEIAEALYYDEPIPPEALPPRVRIPRDEEMLPVGERRIVYSDIDYNMHMNNTRYPDMLCDFIPEMAEGGTLKSLSLSYIKEAPLGAILTLERGATHGDGSFFMRTRNSADEVCLEALIKI